MKPIIKIANLSKQYRLGTIGTGTISNDLKRWWYNARGKEDPFLKIGESNDRSTKGNSEYVWALKDINLEVMPGEVLGIIGKNGAGKSTLLKILSKVTGPTTGSISFNGRIGSLLEVGTGFHPELTGRENIYLNGAILGMTKTEIKSKLDEIIDFSGCERYIDTPVKRYSSGMTVRLGFAVAAHLEPEILVVDEVLAVGDAEFQKKAIGKMQDVSRNDGRTVLFVSHNMEAVKQLCTSSILLENGNIIENGKNDEIINLYLLNSKSRWNKDPYKSNNVTINKIDFSPNPVHSNQDTEFTIQLTTDIDEVINSIGLLIVNQYNYRVGIIDLRTNGNYILKANQPFTISGKINKIPLVEGEYTIGLFLGGNFISADISNITQLNILNKGNNVINYQSTVRGVIDFDYTFNLG